MEFKFNPSPKHGDKRIKKFFAYYCKIGNVVKVMENVTVKQEYTVEKWPKITGWKDVEFL